MAIVVKRRVLRGSKCHSPFLELCRIKWMILTFKKNIGDITSDLMEKNLDTFEQYPS